MWESQVLLMDGQVVPRVLRFSPTFDEQLACPPSMNNRLERVVKPIKQKMFVEESAVKDADQTVPIAC